MGLVIFLTILGTYMLYSGIKFSKKNTVKRLSEEKEGTMYVNMLGRQGFERHVQYFRAPAWIIFGLVLLAYAIYYLLNNVLG